jgi:hypothetical protein
VLEPLLLALAGGDDALPDLGGGLGGALAGDFAELDGRNLDVQVDRGAAEGEIEAGCEEAGLTALLEDTCCAGLKALCFGHG